MVRIREVLISESCVKFLKKRGLENAYWKAKAFLLRGDLGMVDFKKRRPYKSEKYYFRLNRQYRAFAYFDDLGVLHVFEINDHQN